MNKNSRYHFINNQVRAQVRHNLLILRLNKGCLVPKELLIREKGYFFPSSSVEEPDFFFFLAFPLPFLDFFLPSSESLKPSLWDVEESSTKLSSSESSESSMNESSESSNALCSLE